MEFGRPGAAEFAVTEVVNGVGVLRPSVNEVGREGQPRQRRNILGFEQRDVRGAGHRQIIGVAKGKEAGVCRARAKERGRQGRNAGTRINVRRKFFLDLYFDVDIARAVVAGNCRAIGKVAVIQPEIDVTVDDRRIAADRDLTVDISAVNAERRIRVYAAGGVVERDAALETTAADDRGKTRAAWDITTARHLEGLVKDAAAHAHIAALHESAGSGIGVAAAHALPRAAVNDDAPAGKALRRGKTRHNARIITAGLGTIDRVVEMHLVPAASDRTVGAGVAKRDVFDIIITAEREIARKRQGMPAAVQRDFGARLRHGRAGDRKVRRKRDRTAALCKRRRGVHQFSPCADRNRRRTRRKAEKRRRKKKCEKPSALFHKGSPFLFSLKMQPPPAKIGGGMFYSTVTDFARLRGLSIEQPRAEAT